MPNKSLAISRRGALKTLAAGSSAALIGAPAFATSESAARSLVDTAVADVNRVIASGQSESAMLREFERIFRSYADVPTIARSVLGPPARTATPGQLRDFTDAFQDYFSAKYGRRFREFQGSTITVTGSRPVRSFIEVISTVRSPGTSPFELRWLVSDGSGRVLFFNLIIDGVNLLISERNEIGAMLNARGGNVDALTQHLRSLA